VRHRTVIRVIIEYVYKTESYNPCEWLKRKGNYFEKANGINYRISNYSGNVAYII